MLDDLVGGVVGTATDDPGLCAGLVVLLYRGSDGVHISETGLAGGLVGLGTYNRDGVLADVLEPDKLEIAVSVAVNTLGLVLADDDVSQGSAGLEVEDGILPVCSAYCLVSCCMYTE